MPSEDDYDYESFEEILADEVLGLGLPPYSTREQALECCEELLKELQPETVRSTSTRVRKLVAARKWLVEHAGDRPAVSKPHSKELEPISMMVELVKAIREAPAAQSPLPGESIQERAVARRLAAATKATADFRHARTLPLAGLGVAAAALWGSRQVFGADFSHVGTTAWSLGAGFVVLLAAALLLLSSTAQREGERRLRALYDPDRQAVALREAVGGEVMAFRGEALSFSRRDFGRELARACGLHESGVPLSRLVAALSTVDLPSALDDASGLAIARFVENGVLAVDVVIGMEEFRLTPRK